MNKDFRQNSLFYYAICLFCVAIIFHFIANNFGVYESQIENGFVWFDNILHAITGLASSLVFLWILDKNNLNYSTTARIILTLVFVSCFAVVWELIEFGFFKIFTSYAYSLKIYSPSIIEALYDILSNMIGGVLILPFTVKSK